MDGPHDRIDLGIGEELDFPIDWAVLAGDRAETAPPGPVLPEAAVPDAPERPGRRRAGYADLLDHGLPTWTGRIGGRQAILQILAVPLAVAMAVAAMGVIVALTF